MILRRAVPWIASLALHAMLVLLVPLTADLKAMRMPVVERRVVLQLESESPAPPPAAMPAGPSIGASNLPLPPSLPLPAAAVLESVPDAIRAAARVETAPGAIPTPREVLAALPPQAAPSAAVGAEATAAEATVSIGWTGAARTVVRAVNPRFPSILSDTGQEAEVAARITVTPLGAVVDVEITRGSGYTEIDAAVETALRQWIFSRSEGKRNAVGTVSYRFPLEKRD